MRIEERVVPPSRNHDLRSAAVALWGRQQAEVKIVPGGDRGAAYGGDPFGAARAFPLDRQAANLPS